MKKIYPKTGIFVLAVCGFMFTAAFTSASSPVDISKASNFSIQAPAYQELILQIDQTNDKNYDQIRTSLEASGGVFFRGYCAELHVFMYLVDRNEKPDNTFLDKLTAQNIVFLIKEGSTIQQVSDACGMDATPNTSETE